MPVGPGFTGSARIAGKIIDSASGHALEYATVTLLDKKTARTLNGSTNNIAGWFALDNLSTGEYQLLLECIGYRSRTITSLIITKKVEINNLKNIQLGYRQKKPVLAAERGTPTKTLL